MKIVFHSGFKKKYKKLKSAEQKKFQQRLLLFEKNPDSPILNNHQLKGDYKGFYSINITGDPRALYKLVKKDTAFFIDIDTHSNLYS